MTKLHSTETLGLVDGPGIRTVFFLAGCPLRCVFCHNPDSQDPLRGDDVAVEDIIKRAKRMKPYYKDKGGVTLSGGEPLSHPEFVLETIDRLHEEDIHVAIDTSGIGDRRYYKDIVEKADLILLDIKHYDPELFQKITRVKQDRLIDFMEEIEKSDTRIWIRHVMMPGVTDSYQDMDKLVDFVRPIGKNIDRLEILPYHTMGVGKYDQLGRPYDLAGMPAMDKEKAKDFEKYARSLL